MSYDSVEERVLKIIQETVGFNARNSTRSDPRVLGAGVTKACIIRYGGFRIAPASSLNRHAFIWTVMIDLWFHSRQDLVYYNTEISTAVQDILIQLLGYPTLDGLGSITQVLPGDASDPERMQAGGSQNWWRVSFPLLVTEMQTVPILET